MSESKKPAGSSDQPVPHDTVTTAALHALNALTAAEAAGFEDRLRRGHAEAAAEYHSFRLVADHLADSAPAVAPAPALKTRLLALVANGKENETAKEPIQATQVWRDWTSTPDADGIFTLAAEETGWQKTEIEGIDVRNLFADRERNYVTMLVRMAPGTSYPTHRHAGVEECYVVQGDLRVPPGRHLHAGDYQRAAGESLHGVQSTDEGCLLLIVSSTEDELL